MKCETIAHRQLTTSSSSSAFATVKRAGKTILRFTPLICLCVNYAELTQTEEKTSQIAKELAILQKRERKASHRKLEASKDFIQDEKEFAVQLPPLEMGPPAISISIEEELPCLQKEIKRLEAKHSKAEQLSSLHWQRIRKNVLPTLITVIALACIYAGIDSA